ncbi:MAG: hypothetical protein AMXMBFR64_15580 [Myxococcales bacterium]
MACAPTPREIRIGPLSPCADVGLEPGDLAGAAERAARWLTLVPYEVEATYERDGDDTEALRPVAGERLAVLSFPEPTGDDRIDPWFVPVGRSFAYDDALVAIVLLERGEPGRAAGVLRTLESLQADDGAIGFSFNTIGDTFYNRRYVRAGTVAWVGYAFAMYERVTGEHTFRAAALRAAAWLLRQRVDAPGDPRDGLVLGGSGRWDRNQETFHPDFVLDAAVTEHQVDAWFFLDLLSALTGDGELRQAASWLGDAVEQRLWLAEEGRFAAAAREDGLVLDEALDAAGSWTALMLLARGRAEAVPGVLDRLDRRFGLRRGVLVGHRAYAGVSADHGVDWDLLPSIWSEGTLGVALAKLRAGDGTGARELLATVARLQCAAGAGGVPVASHDAPDLTVGVGAAPTAWLVLVAGEASRGPSPFPLWALATGAPMPYTSPSTATSLTETRHDSTRPTRTAPRGLR